MTVYLGALASVAAFVRFVTAFPAAWDPASGQPATIGLSGIDLLVIATGGVFIPVLTDRAELEAQASSL